MVNRAASEYLLADVAAKRVNFTSIRATLPADADTLLTLHRFSGGINVGELALGHIALYDVTFDRPRLNLMVASDSINNFSIIPPSDTTATDGTTVIPPLSINRFA